jgi:hypothetical protein
MCLGRRTLTGLICTQGDQFRDWSKYYRLFENERFEIDTLFTPIRSAVCRHLPKNMPVIATLDDTIMRKRGKKVAGASWRRDPMGPAFRTNFVWAQRFVQMSLIAPTKGFGSSGRGIPVDIVHAPTPAKPTKSATEEQLIDYRSRQTAMRVSKVGAERIIHLRSKLNDDSNSKDRLLIVGVDGGYTNRTVFRSIPENTVLIGRIRKDASLFEKPVDQPNGRGRNRLYADRMPTPDEYRQMETIPWQGVTAFAAGKTWTFDVKVVRPVRWKAAGGRDAQLVIIRPLAIRPTKGSRLQYRDPAYLLCTDVDLPIEQLLQAYLWRWEIEVNFREEKTIMGTGQAQVRTKTAVQTTTTFSVASYAMLHAAALNVGLYDNGIPLPKWRNANITQRCSTNQLVSRLRAEAWGTAIGTNINGFVTKHDLQRSLQNQTNKLGSAILYAKE